MPLMIFIVNFIFSFYRIYTNTDTFHKLLESSDPLVTSSRKLPQRKVHALTAEMKELLILDKNCVNEMSDIESDDDQLDYESSDSDMNLDD